MLSAEQLSQLTKHLIAMSADIPKEVLCPTVIPEAGLFVVSNPYAFAMAVCLDRGAKAEVIWTIPYDIRMKLGHLDPVRIYQMSIPELTALFAELPRRPRYVNDAPRTIHELSRIVVEECAGDAANMWKHKRAAEVKRTFVSIHGVGEGIANMGVLLIEKAFDVRFSDLDRTRMDIKPDVHTVRVLYRLGVSEAPTVEAALAAARRMNPAFPGGVDGGLWQIGRTWCFPSNPACRACPVRAYCEKRMG